MSVSDVQRGGQPCSSKQASFSSTPNSRRTDGEQRQGGWFRDFVENDLALVEEAVADSERWLIDEITQYAISEFRMRLETKIRAVEVDRSIVRNRDKLILIQPAASPMDGAVASRAE